MKNVSELLNSFFASAVPDQDADESVGLLSSWRKIAGSAIGAHTRIADIKHGAVLVYCDHPGWMQKLGFEKQRILRTMQQEYPDLKITNMHYQLVDAERMNAGNIEAERKALYANLRSIREKGRQQYLASGETEQAEGEEHVNIDAIPDPDLRDRLRKFLDSADD